MSIDTESTASLFCTDEKKAAGGLDKSASDSDAHEDEAEDEDDPESDADAYENDADEDFMDDAVKPWSSWTTTFQGLLDTARCSSIQCFLRLQPPEPDHFSPLCSIEACLASNISSKGSVHRVITVNS